MMIKYKEKLFLEATHKLLARVKILSYFKYAKIIYKITSMKGMIWFRLHLNVK